MNHNPQANLLETVRLVAIPWQYTEHEYFKTAEKNIDCFWNQDSLFRQMFGQLNLSNVVELACGHGRHAVRIAAACGSLTLIDIFPEHLNKCRNRLAGMSNVHYLLGNGYNFNGISDASVTAIYSYDAMVHFAPAMMKSYLLDAARILVPGGRFLSHHSNYSANPDAKDFYSENPHARHHMSYELLTSFAAEAKLEILQSIPMAWGNDVELDRVTIFQKPKNLLSIY